MYFKILSIDGGGIRGIIPGCVLVDLERELQACTKDPTLRIGDCFDMIAGTSTGGILACLLLAPDPDHSGRARFSAADAVQLYMENGDAIFDRSVWQRIHTADGLSDEKYSAKSLERILASYFDDLQLAQLIRPSLITAYDTKRYRPVFFTQHDAKVDAQQNYLVREVARATSAAPTYFEPALPESLDTIPNAMPMVDGGVFANNPAACALVEALKMKLEPAVKMQDVVILSLGTGRRSTSISFRECKDWGLVSWARPLVNIFMEGVSQTVDYQLKTVFTSMGIAPQYVRIDGAFDDIAARLEIEGLDPAMDHASPENLGRLQNFGRQLAMNSRDTLKQFAENYCAQSPGRAWGT